MKINAFLNQTQKAQAINEKTVQLDLIQIVYVHQKTQSWKKIFRIYLSGKVLLSIIY